MKQIVKLTIILSLLSQICHAQRVETEEEYKAYNDSIISLLKVAEKDASSYVGKPFSELVKHFEKCGVKIQMVSPFYNFDRGKISPQHIYGIELMFIPEKLYGFVGTNMLKSPEVYINFEGSKPYEKAANLDRIYKGSFTNEVEAFYSDAVIKTIKFTSMDDNIYYDRSLLKDKKYLPSSKREAKTQQER